MNILVENLHYYVDVLLDTLIEYYQIGLFNNSSIFKNIINDETNHYLKLGMNLKNKKLNKNITISEDNALELIFNGYNGNIIEKALDRVIRQTGADNAPLHKTKSLLLEGQIHN